MEKPKIIIADTDLNFVIPLQNKFIVEFFGKVNIEVITKKEYFDSFFNQPQKADILIVASSLYNNSLQKQDISHVFVADEQIEEEQTGDLNVVHILKYTSIKEIFNEIVGKSADSLKIKSSEKKETQVVLVYSSSGGTGKTTIAMGVSASLAKSYKRVLYINASRLQSFHHMLNNYSSISSMDVYTNLTVASDDVYNSIKHIIRNEGFSYLPPFKAALMSTGLSYSVFAKIIESAKKSKEYDFIIVDADTTFDEDKASLLNMADKVLIVTNQTKAAVLATNILVFNLNGVTSEKYIFVCNNFDKNEDNALISPSVSCKFTINDYVEHFEHYEKLKPADLAKENSMQRVAYLLV